MRSDDNHDPIKATTLLPCNWHLSDCSRSAGKLWAGVSHRFTDCLTCDRDIKTRRENANFRVYSDPAVAGRDIITDSLAG